MSETSAPAATPPADMARVPRVLALVAVVVFLVLEYFYDWPIHLPW